MPRKKSDVKEPWEGDSSDDWEPEENLDPDLMSAFEETRPKKEREPPATAAADTPLDESLATRKRGRKKKKNNVIEEIEKPRGVDRGLQPEKILAAQLYNSSLFYLVKWQDCTDFDVVLGKDLNQHFPDFVIQYYESCVPFSVRHKIGRIPRIAPELPPPPEVPDMPMDVSDNLVPPPMGNEEQLPEENQELPTLSEMPQMPEMPGMPEMPLPDLSMPEESTESQAMEVPVN